MKKALSICLLLGLLAACTSYRQEASVPKTIGFTDLPKIQLAVSDIEVANEYKPTMADPNVDHLANPTPTAVLQSWVKDRLQAKGSNQFKARVIIRDASITDNKLPVAEGWRGWFVNEEANRYTGKMAISVEIVRPDGYVEAYVSAKAEESRTTKENARLTDKENAWFDLTQAMAQSVNAELEKQIKVNFGPILTPQS
jgi:hypothetical protein